MERSGIVKQNFITLFRINTLEEIQRPVGTGKKTFAEFFNGFSEKIGKLNSPGPMFATKPQYNVGIQKFDLCLEIAV